MKASCRSSRRDGRIRRRPRGRGDGLARFLRSLPGFGGNAAARSAGLPSGMRAGWVAVLAALLFALSWQSFLTQTHHHFSPDSVSAAPAKADAGGPERPSRQSPADPSANCPVCRVLAHAGPVLLPAQIDVAAPAPASVWRIPTSLPRLALARRSHDWRSRAPPERLQA